VERLPGTYNFRQTDLSMSDWQEYAFWSPVVVVGADWREIATSKKVTNPPRIFDCVEEYLTVSYFCEQERYVVPLEYLGEGIKAGIQDRELIGIIASD